MNRAAPAPRRLVLSSLARLLSPLLLALFLCLTAQGQKREPRKLFPISGGGFIDRTGKIVIPPVGADFSEVVQSGRYRLPTGPSWASGDEDPKVKDPYRRRVHIGNFSEGLARFSIDTRPGSRALFLAYGYLDETGKVVIPPGAEYRSHGDFHDGRALAEGDGGKRGYIDRTGRFVIPPVYQLTWGFSEGLASACREYYKCGYIDTEGRVVIPFKFYAATHFNEGLALVGLDGEEMAYIDREGRIVFKLSKGLYGGDFSEGLAWVRDELDGKYGFMDRAGRIRIPMQFEEVRGFSEGKALVKKGDSWGFIDRAGRTVIPFQYAYGSSFSEGLAAVTTARERMEAGWGFIDHTGRVVVPLTLDYAEPFSGGLAAIDTTVDGNPQAIDAYIDRAGRVVWERTKHPWEK